MPSVMAEHDDADRVENLATNGGDGQSQLGSFYRSARLLFSFFCAALLGVCVYEQWLGVPADYKIYTQYYADFLQPERIQFTQVEPGFRLIFEAGNRAGISLSAVLGLCAFVSIFVKLSVLNRLSPAFAPIAVYAAVLFPLHEYTQVRVAFALAFVYVAFLGLDRGRRWFVIPLLAAPIFHYSTTILVLLILQYWAIQFASRRLAILSVFIAFISFIAVIQFRLVSLSFTNIGNYDQLTYDVIPSPFTITTMLYVAAIAAMIARRRSRDRAASALAICLCLLGPLSLAALADTPAFAFRFKELFSSLGPIALGQYLGWQRGTWVTLSVICLMYLYAAGTVVSYISSQLISF